MSASVVVGMLSYALACFILFSRHPPPPSWLWFFWSCCFESEKMSERMGVWVVRVETPLIFHTPAFRFRENDSPRADSDFLCLAVFGYEKNGECGIVNTFLGEKDILELWVISFVCVGLLWCNRIPTRCAFLHLLICWVRAHLYSIRDDFF